MDDDGKITVGGIDYQILEEREFSGYQILPSYWQDTSSDIVGQLVESEIDKRGSELREMCHLVDVYLYRLPRDRDSFIVEVLETGSRLVKFKQRVEFLKKL